MPLKPWVSNMYCTTIAGAENQTFCSKTVGIWRATQQWLWRLPSSNSERCQCLMLLFLLMFRKFTIITHTPWHVCAWMQTYTHTQQIVGILSAHATVFAHVTVYVRTYMHKYIHTCTQIIFVCMIMLWLHTCTHAHTLYMYVWLYAIAICDICMYDCMQLLCMIIHACMHPPCVYVKTSG
jgi:hypothetical protein